MVVQRNVISEVVDHGLCIGCGLCAGVCPSQNLKISLNDYGEYSPFDQGRCLDNCSLCMKVCPFMEGNDKEDLLGNRLFGSSLQIKRTEETGYYSQSYVGYSSNRDIAASGGMTSYLLEELLNKALVDKIICVAPSNSQSALFKYVVLETTEGIKTSAGSAYYPVQLSDVIRYVQSTPGNYAITALPCFAKAIRLASDEMPVLRKRIKFVLGLTCGQLKNTFYTRYIAHLSGVDEPLKSCFFRKKRPDQPANNFTFTCQGVSGKEGNIMWNQGVSRVWVNRWFTPNACNYCDDVFAECADAVFMDAWLPNYRDDPKGTSLVVVRNPEIQVILDEMVEKEATLKPIPIAEVIRSQAGVVRIKRNQLSYRLHRVKKRGRKTPEKRVNSSSLWPYLFQRKEIETLDEIQRISRQLILDVKNGKADINDIHKKIVPYLKRLGMIRKQRAIVALPLRAIRKMLRLIRSRW